ncbi:hypothetical protein GOP47_0019849 [Adiantum capillus-veneris]|uniref:Pectin acetylesterase n=1 Tax=Adiantum capillus-veneris TaxID=13818 RepID=A0A9D4Z850_ADICA|nr:hypothetical protein GOP47_0019849 [Adiantum capillus-veneris]
MGMMRAANACCVSVVLVLIMLVLEERGSLGQPPLVYLSEPGDAVCLDGSPPAYSFDPGSGSGQNSWIVHLQGGGWCGSVDDCLQRSFTDLGSSKYMTPFAFGGFLSNSPSNNPDFYNWNRVYIRYCDGASFAGNAVYGMPVTSNNQASYLYFRGQKVWEAVVDDLLAKGLGYGDRAILSGDSAGGLGVILLCNRFQQKLSSTTDVKCVADGGFFMNIPNIAGVYAYQEFYQYVVTLHEITILPSQCTAQMSFAQCYFPEDSVAYIDVPIFILQSPYDSFQVKYILAPPSSYSDGSWDACTQDLSACSPSQLAVIQDQLSAKMLETLSPLVGSPGWGMYLVSCYYHTQLTNEALWNGVTTINGMNPAQAFRQWYFGGELMQAVDCPYPCNPTCI